MVVHSTDPESVTHDIQNSTDGWIDLLAIMLGAGYATAKSDRFTAQELLYSSQNYSQEGVSKSEGETRQYFS